MTNKTISVSLGRARLPLVLAHDLMALEPGLRGRVVALVLIAKATDLDLTELVAVRKELRRACVLLNQSLQFPLGPEVDRRALNAAVRLINSLHL
jgi:hypothetical protein